MSTFLSLPLQLSVLSTDRLPVVSAIGHRGTSFPHLQKTAQGVLRPRIFHGRRRTVRGTSCRPNLRWLYTVAVSGYHIIFAFQTPVKSDRAKSKLESCGATWLQKRLAMGPVTTAAGSTTTNRSPTPSIQSPTS